MIITTDLHIHSSYSKHTHQPFDFSMLAKNARTKGIDVLGTGDCLHPQWLQEIQTLDTVDEGTFKLGGTYFILSSEIETKDHIHHLILFPSINAVETFVGRVNELYTNNIREQAKPWIQCSSEQLVSHCIEVDGLIGPAHIFDVLSGMYSTYDSLYECYHHMSSYIHFVELGLGVDTRDADMISELHDLTFLSNSDTNNPHPIRLGREFTRFEVKHPSFTQIKQAITRTHGNRPVLNCGFPPEEGKYYETACSHCQRKYSRKQARKRLWKCTCGHQIKKGVRDRIIEKASYSKTQHPLHRPLYLCLLPLHEIITRALDAQNPFTDMVSDYYDQLISTFGNEIRVLLETPIEDIARTTIAPITESIQAFRNATIRYRSGGGGMYGTLDIPWEKERLRVSIKRIQ
jgi:uncharacterized protein (TIGR00375 family)